MNKNEKAIKELQNGIASFYAKLIENAPFNKTITGKVLSINGNKSNILANGIEYNNVPKLSNITVLANDIVKINVPQNNMNNMYIEGKLG